MILTGRVNIGPASHHQLDHVEVPTPRRHRQRRDRTARRRVRRGAGVQQKLDHRGMAAHRGRGERGHKAHRHLLDGGRVGLEEAADGLGVSRRGRPDDAHLPAAPPKQRRNGLHLLLLALLPRLPL